MLLRRQTLPRYLPSGRHQHKRPNNQLKKNQTTRTRSTHPSVESANKGCDKIPHKSLGVCMHATSTHLLAPSDALEIHIHVYICHGPNAPWNSLAGVHHINRRPLDKKDHFNVCSSSLLPHQHPALKSALLLHHANKLR